jgi:hypothetical protein
MIGVGIEVTTGGLRVASAERRRGRAVLIRVHGDDAGAGLRSRAPRALAAFPLARTTHRLLTLPFGDERTLAQVVPLEMRGQLPGEPSDARIGFEIVARTPTSAQVLALVVRAHDLDAAARAAAQTGATLAGLTAAPLALRWLLPRGFTGTVLLADGRETTVSVWDGGAPRALRALAACARDGDAVIEELAWSLPALEDASEPFVLAGPDAADALLDACRRRHPTAARLSLEHLAAETDAAAVRAAPVACALALGALDARARVAFALPAMAPSLLTPRVRRLALAAAVVAAFDVGIARLELAARAARTEAALEAEAARALPGEPIVAPRAQLEAAVARARHAAGSAAYGSALVRLREVSERVPEGLVLDVTRLTLEGEHLQLVGSAPTFETVDVLRRALTGSARLRDVVADEVRTTVDGTRVSFRLRARWVAPGEASS